MTEEPYVKARRADGKYTAVPKSQYEAMAQDEAMKQFNYYTWKGVECKDVIETMVTGLSGIEAYYMGNIIKYLYRYPKKGTLETDLAKAAQYMEFLKEHFAKKEEKRTC